jgi:hypothetical protein
MEAFCAELNLTILGKEYGELVYSLSEPTWLSDKHARIFRAFLLAWDEAPCRLGILARFRSNGRCPVDRLQPLNNHHTRKVTPDEMLTDSREDPHDIGSCLLSSIQTLSYLDRSLKRVFADNDRVIEMTAQWENLICFPVADGIFLSAPS